MGRRHQTGNIRKDCDVKAREHLKAELSGGWRAVLLGKRRQQAGFT